MNASFSEFLILGGRMIVPYLFILFLFLLNVVSLSYVFMGAVKAPFFLMAVYYWAIFRPAIMPAWFVFAAGILIDLLSGLPIGISAVVFLLVRWTIANQRKFLMAQPFMMMWSIFAAIAVMAGLLQWGLFGLVNLGWTPLTPVAVSIILGIVIFPPIGTVLHWTRKALPASGGFGP
jgi:rod shape-determining protein MreD